MDPVTGTKVSSRSRSRHVLRTFCPEDTRAELHQRDGAYVNPLRVVVARLLQDVLQGLLEV